MAKNMTEPTTEEIKDSPRLSALERDMSDMKSLMSKMVDALTRMALLEERQQTVQATTSKTAETVQNIKDQLAASELAFAKTAITPGRIESIERTVREDHIEHERNKARFQTLVWTVRTGAACFAALAAYVIWISTHLPAAIVH